MFVGRPTSIRSQNLYPVMLFVEFLNTITAISVTYSFFSTSRGINSRSPTGRSIHFILNRQVNSSTFSNFNQIEASFFSVHPQSYAL
ncbi:hypothetical protein BDN72DRAFT_102994 [Pluteus cervinus]|uniref:Uncharacterized protein n=1 Tax=Pluteus cervinus TaxID=181527 RepID=A0ACD3B8I8_9AGAR|nr:hypothetical protein BDN72DRAFT_102994 [Pluteus cervinus]